MILGKDTIVLITGGASGLGEAIASIFLQRECFVLVVDIKEGNSQSLQYHYGPRRYQFFKCDVTDELQVSELFFQIKGKYKKIDYLINAAAINKDNHEQTEYPSTRMTKYAFIFMARQDKPKNQQNSGVIIDVSSGLEIGIEDAKKSGLCPSFFKGGIRTISVPMRICTDSIHSDLLKDIAYGIFKLIIVDQKYNQQLHLLSMNNPSL